ncbi:MAG TPA: hypothetical protein VFQ80_00475 [Thermomicrobiales bacterium]|nr:hypothetical protein [Thermomicrobiales bacterium]
MAAQIDRDDPMLGRKVCDLVGEKRVISGPTMDEQKRRLAPAAFRVRQRDTIAHESSRHAAPIGAGIVDVAFNHSGLHGEILPLLDRRRREERWFFGGRSSPPAGVNRASALAPADRQN